VRALALFTAVVLLAHALACADVFGFQDLTGPGSCGDASGDASSSSDAGGCGQPCGG
jgi:hypothetical protein